MDNGNLFGRVIQAARREQRISQRELARRSGVSPSQISRIESGETSTPVYWTVDAIAQALGKRGDLLGILAHVSQDSVMEEHVDYLQRLSGIDFEIVPGEVTNDQHEKIRAVLYQEILEQSVFEHLTGAPNNSHLERVVSCWPGLTDERRKAVAAFVNDQLTLSELERRRGTAEEEVA